MYIGLIISYRRGVYMFEYDNNAKLAVEILDKYDISEELLDWSIVK